MKRSLARSSPTSGAHHFHQPLHPLIWRRDPPDGEATYAGLDWEAAAARLTRPEVVYPPYYCDDWHDARGGLPHNWQAIGWSVAAIFSPLEPHYARLSLRLARRHPHGVAPHILDMGCGTGDWAIHLGRLLPAARFTMLDLSPTMLAVSHHRWQRAGLTPERGQWHHALGEATDLTSNSCDEITCLLLLHALPPDAVRRVLHEARRLLRPGGVLTIFDAIQRPMQPSWLNRLGERVVAAAFRVADFPAYAQLDLPALAHDAGFRSTRTLYYGRLPWKFQVTETS